MNWADKEIKKAERLKQSRETSEQLRVIEHRIKGEVGPELFGKVAAYVQTEIGKFNAAQQNTADGMSFIPGSSVTEENDLTSQIPSFTARKKDGRCPYVYVKYSHARSMILWKRGASDDFYELRVHEDGKGYFVGSDGNPREVHQIGDELLTLAKNA